MSKKKLNIAFFHLAFFYSGGGEKLVLQEIEALRKRGHNVDCFTPTLDKKHCFPDIINKFSIKIILPIISKISFKHESIEILLTCIFFPFIAKRFKNYDIVIGANQPGPWFGWCIKKLTGISYLVYLAQPTRILHPRKVDLDTGVWVKKKAYLIPFVSKVFRLILNWIDRVSIKNADRILVNGEYMKKVISKVYEVKCISCPSGSIPTSKIVKERLKGRVKVNGFNINKPYLLLTNRHFPQKKFEYAVDLIKKLVVKYPNILLVITGNKTMYTKLLKKYVKKLGIAKNILFTGFIKEKDLANLYKNAAIYLYTSPEEDFGMGVIEAMGFGTPVIAWNKAGPSKTIIDGKTGYLIQAYSQEELYKKVISLLKNNKNILDLGENGIKHVEENFSLKKHFDLLEKNIIDVYSSGRY